MAYGEVYSLCRPALSTALRILDSYDQNSHCEVAEYITSTLTNMPAGDPHSAQWSWIVSPTEDQALLYKCAKESELW